MSALNPHIQAAAVTLAGLLGWLFLPATAIAADPASAVAPSIELNKLETTGTGCRAYLVVNNPGAASYQSFKLDLVLFQTDGVIGKRFALDLAPLKAQKTTVKLFDIDAIACDRIGSFLINDVIACQADTGPAQDCLQRLTVSALTTAKLSK